MCALLRLALAGLAFVLCNDGRAQLPLDSDRAPENYPTIAPPSPGNGSYSTLGTLARGHVDVGALSRDDGGLGLESFWSRDRVAAAISPGRSTLSVSPTAITGNVPFDLVCRMEVPPSVLAIGNLEVVMSDGLGNLKSVAWLPGTIYPAGSTSVVFTMPYPQGVAHAHGSEDSWVVRARYSDQFGIRRRTTLCDITVD